MAVVALCAVATLLFTQAVVRLRRRGRPDLAGRSRVALFAAGIALVPVSLLVLDVRADENLTWHMTQHVLIGDLSPALLVLAVRGPLALFLLPPAVLKPLARTPLRKLVRPRIAYALWAANLAVWHVPALYDAALQIHGGYGFTEEFAISRFFRDQKILEIGEGTNEVQRMVIAKQLGL